MKQNIFYYATSELSQDAFICWLLSCASPDYKKIDENLYNCSIEFIKSLLKKQNQELQSVNSIEIIRQYKKIDILCIVNGKYVILIEDKTNTQNHSNQLERYLNTVKKDYNEYTIIPIYFKTGEQSNYKNIGEYKEYLRDDFLKILNYYEKNNNIIIDYRSYLQSITDKIKSYASLPISDWKGKTWIGFYQKLQEKLKSGDWKKVNNQNNGFYGFYWCPQIKNDYKIYLLLEQDKLCFKIKVTEKENRKKIRKEFSDLIIEKAKKQKLDLIKPKKFGNGEHMTICIFNGEYRKVKKNKLIDIDETIKVLKKVEEILKET